MYCTHVLDMCIGHVYWTCVLDMCVLDMCIGHVYWTHIWGHMNWAYNLEQKEKRQQRQKSNAGKADLFAGLEKHFGVSGEHLVDAVLELGTRCRRYRSERNDDLRDRTERDRDSSASRSSESRDRSESGTLAGVSAKTSEKAAGSQKKA